MQTLATIIGLAAAVLTTVANVPQVLKAWRTRQTEDLSLVTISTLATGLVLWVIYGVLQGDAVLVGANAVALFVAVLLAALKLWHG